MLKYVACLIYFVTKAIQSILSQIFSACFCSVSFVFIHYVFYILLSLEMNISLRLRWPPKVVWPIRLIYTPLECLLTRVSFFTIHFLNNFLLQTLKILKRYMQVAIYNSREWLQLHINLLNTRNVINRIGSASLLTHS